MYIAKIKVEEGLLSSPDYVEMVYTTKTYFVCLYSLPRKNFYACSENLLNRKKTSVAQFRTKIIARIEAKRLIGRCSFFHNAKIIVIIKKVE